MAAHQSTIQSELQEMTGREFEQFVAKLWKKQGWRTRVTSGSGDRGIDVVARRRNPSKKCLIQAKRYAGGNKVGAREVREYAGLYRQESDVDEVVVVTTSSFTKQAREVAGKSGVTLVDGSELRRKIRSNGGTDLIEGYHGTDDAVSLLVSLAIVGSGAFVIQFTSWQDTVMGWWVGPDVTTVPVIGLWFAASAVLFVGSAAASAHGDTISRLRISSLLCAVYFVTYLLGSGALFLARRSAGRSQSTGTFAPSDPTGVWIGDWMATGAEIWTASTAIAVLLVLFLVVRD